MHVTLNSEIVFKGIGLHGGQSATLKIVPAERAHGIVFHRTDVSGGEIPARFDLVSDTRLCTKLSNDAGVSVGTVEHVMAALAGSGVTDALLMLDGPEVPIMDGSSAPFINAIANAGTRNLGGPLAAIRIISPIAVDMGDRFAELSPADRFEMDFSIDFEDAAIGEQRHSMTLVNGAFAAELSDCRTFGRLAEVEQLRSIGLARGGSLKNAIVVDEGRVLNPEGLRRPDEFVRHKMLDAVGDLALAGAPIIGRYTARKAGHEVTNILLRELFARPDAWVWDTLDRGQSLNKVPFELGRGSVVEAMAV